MKRVAWVVFMAALGVACEWVTPLLMDWVAGDGPTGQASDIEGSLKVFFGLGGALFAMLGAWIGWTTWRHRMRALWMGAAVVVVSVVIVLLTDGGHLRHLFRCQHLLCDSAAVIAWAVLATVAAVVVQQILTRKGA